MKYETIEYERIGQVARIWHNRPHVGNAQDEALLIELEDAIDTTAKDPEVRVVVIAGRGKHFSAGHDVKEGYANRNHFNTEERYEWEAKHYFGLSLKIWDHPKPTIAQVQGACIAGGFMTANVCDMIMAADSAFFSEPVIHSMGITSVEVLMHPWVMNHRKAKEFLLTGMRMSAAEALQVGMINHVVPAAELEERTLALAQRIADAPPFAARMLKRSVNRTLEIQGLRGALQAHFDTHELTHTSRESYELVNGGGESGMLSKGKQQG